MPESTMFADLLAAQKAMPHLQKSAINPHFKNRYVPLEELLQVVIPILNEHNFVLLQMPTATETGPALQYGLHHVSGEQVKGIMPLLCAKGDPQGQGSAITYARRYSLMSLLGLTADVDDDAETTRQAPKSQDVARPRPSPATTNGNGYPLPPCPQGHGAMKLWPAGTSKAGKPVSANYKCTNRDCKSENGYPESIWEDRWITQVNMARGQGQEAFAGSSVDPDELPFE